MKINSLAFMVVLLLSGSALEAASQSIGGAVKTGVLQTRHRDDVAGTDNYEYATFSFLAGANGPDAQKLVRNDWDIQFSARTTAGKKTDYFHVTMVVDDRSRIVDLGKLEWSDDFALPDLPAYDKPTREEPVEATIGHIYYVHTADRNSDHYALFRVEEMNSGVNVSITWKLLGNPSENPK